MPKISDKRIVCPAMAYRFFEHEKLKDENPCTQTYCCFHCSKRNICKNKNGCKDDLLSEYPEKCDCYPLTFGEAKTIYLFLKMLDKQTAEEPALAYFYFARKVEAYIKEKKKLGK